VLRPRLDDSDRCLSVVVQTGEAEMCLGLVALPEHGLVGILLRDELADAAVGKMTRLENRVRQHTLGAVLLDVPFSIVIEPLADLRVQNGTENEVGEVRAWPFGLGE